MRLLFYSILFLFIFGCINCQHHRYRGKLNDRLKVVIAKIYEIAKSSKSLQPELREIAIFEYYMRINDVMLDSISTNTKDGLFSRVFETLNEPLPDFNLASNLKLFRKEIDSVIRYKLNQIKENDAPLLQAEYDEIIKPRSNIMFTNLKNSITSLSKSNILKNVHKQMDFYWKLLKLMGEIVYNSDMKIKIPVSNLPLVYERFKYFKTHNLDLEALDDAFKLTLYAFYQGNQLPFLNFSTYLLHD